MKLTILHLYPDLLNLYGDRGNIQCMAMRCRWRGIDAEVLECDINSRPDFARADIVLLGGGSDREQRIVCDKLLEIRDDLSAYVEDGGTLLAVCGGYQLIGRFYDTPQGRIRGLSLVDLYTVQGSPRLISNVVLKSGEFPFEIVGFENHGGRTYIAGMEKARHPSEGQPDRRRARSPAGHTPAPDKDSRSKTLSKTASHAHEGILRPFGRVLYGYGNNGMDGTEGILYKNVIGTYLHGPLLPKNPHVCDRLLRTALDRKYGRTDLEPLDDREELSANRVIAQRYKTR